MPAPFPLFPFFTLLPLERSVAHAARGGDGRQEGRECGYYHLHRNLNESLFHSVLLFIVTQIFTDLHRFYIPSE